MSHAGVYLPARGARGLLVEDEYPALERRRTLLTFKDLDVVPAASRSDALSRLRNLGFRVDVVLTDINLTGVDGSAEGIDIAQAIFDHWGGAVPVYGYSGKNSLLSQDQRGLFRDVVLKGDFSDRVRGLFNRASSAGLGHLAGQVQRAEGILSPLQQEPKPLTLDEIGLIRDLVAGSIPAPESPSHRFDTIGFLALTASGVGVPYGLRLGNTEPDALRIYASVLGHHYLETFGSSVEDAVNALEDLLVGFLDLTAEEDSESVGASRRMRRLFDALRTRASEVGESSETPAKA